MLKRYCMNCQRETEFHKGVCPHCRNAKTCCTCGGPIPDFDEYGNPNSTCPNDCEFENVQEELSYKRQYKNNCWKCGQGIDSNICQPDKVREFAYICSNPLCGVSLREHPDVRKYVANYRNVPVEDITDEILHYMLSIPKR